MSLPATSDAVPYRRLLSAARELFARKGYVVTPVREIVTSAGVTKPVLYYYFRSKEGIYLELIGKAFKKLDRLLDVSRRWQGSATERLNMLCDRLFFLFTDHQETLSLIQGPPPGAPFYNFEPRYRKLKDAIGELIKEGIQHKKFPNVNVEAQVSAIIGGLYIAAQDPLRGRRTAPDRKRYAEIIRIIFQGIGMAAVRRKG